MIWANLLHLGMNMWLDRDLPGEPESYVVAKPYVRWDRDLWVEVTERMAEAGFNMLVIDLGEAVRYESHPEIAVEGALSVDELRAELARLRGLGLEPIPKLNFSTTHDVWLGLYSRMVSSPVYYEVCADLIDEVISIFDGPSLFHIGMDEELLQHQRCHDYVVLRQYDLWWHDLMFFVERIEARGSQAWMWSDYMWTHPEEFVKRMPTSIMQSNWYYGSSFSEKLVPVRSYRTLSEHGFEQIVTPSNVYNDVNIARTVNYAAKNLRRDLLRGFLIAPWIPTLPEFRERHLAAVEQTRAAKQRFERL